MIIDSHTHLLRSKYFDEERLGQLGWVTPPDTDINVMVDWWKQAGIDKMVCMGQSMERVWNTSFDNNEYVFECYDKYPDFIIPFYSLEPIDQANCFNQRVYDELEELLPKGVIKGVLLTPPYGQYKSNDKTAYPFYQLFQKQGVIVQYHHSAMDGCSHTFAPTKYAQMVDLNDVVMDFPKMKVVVEHLAYPQTEHLFTIMANSDCIYADLAMAYDRSMTIAWDLVQAREYGVLDRIMFATDYVAYGQYPYSENPVNELARWIDMVKNGFNEINKRCGWPLLTQEEIDGIMYKNVARLYDLDV